MEYKVLLTALAEAQEELVEVEFKFERLRIDRERLQAIVHSISAYLPDVTVTSGPASGETNPPEIQVPAWVSVKEVLEQNGQPMNVPAIFEVLQERKITQSRDNIRIAMLRKPDVFFAQGAGLYGLTEWNSRSPSIYGSNPELITPAHRHKIVFTHVLRGEQKQQELTEVSS